MSGVTKAKAAAFERRMGEELTKAFGPPESGSPSRLVWRFDRPEGRVELSLKRDSLLEGRAHRARALFARITETGDVQPWGTSGKNNCHILSDLDTKSAVRAAIFHVVMATKQDTPARAAAETMKFDA